MGSKTEKRTRVMGSGEKEVVTMEDTGISADVREQIYKVGMPENAKKHLLLSNQSADTCDSFEAF
ncbi:hypothetical protein Pyn_05869 [Prunus yedoensis var. nudiflora]|uniref:Uncharacterized protein n=1 Tax=Prunus yedoensis var. nudiflora TaxID=2094558 RepID=A0A314Y9M9_PRUYE|nr:hypothetical protein Pyn_05869 [Prunus yedoensis var. nudiflora]